MRLSWLEIAYSLHFWASDFQRSVGQTDVVFGMRSGFISRSMHARLQVSVCSGYDLCHPGYNIQTHTETCIHRQTAFWSAVWRVRHDAFTDFFISSL